MQQEPPERDREVAAPPVAPMEPRFGGRAPVGGPYLDDLSREQLATAVLQVRCEHDRTVVGVVLAGYIISRVEREPRSRHDQQLLMPCHDCPLHAVHPGRDGSRERQAERWASSRLIWQQVDRRRKSVRLSEVLANQ